MRVKFDWTRNEMHLMTLNMEKQGVFSTIELVLMIRQGEFAPLVQASTFPRLTKTILTFLTDAAMQTLSTFELSCIQELNLKM